MYQLLAFVLFRQRVLSGNPLFSEKPDLDMSAMALFGRRSMSAFLPRLGDKRTLGAPKSKRPIYEYTA